MRFIGKNSRYQFLPIDKLTSNLKYIENFNGFNPKN